MIRRSGNPLQPSWQPRTTNYTQLLLVSTSQMLPNGKTSIDEILSQNPNCGWNYSAQSPTKSSSRPSSTTPISYQAPLTPIPPNPYEELSSPKAQQSPQITGWSGQATMDELLAYEDQLARTTPPPGTSRYPAKHTAYDMSIYTKENNVKPITKLLCRLLETMRHLKLKGKSDTEVSYSRCLHQPIEAEIKRVSC